MSKLALPMCSNFFSLIFSGVGGVPSLVRDAGTKNNNKMFLSYFFPFDLCEVVVLQELTSKSSQPLRFLPRTFQSLTLQPT